MRISATVAELKFDVKGAEDDFLGALYHVMLQAAEQFLKVAAPAVPVETGMARGSFLNLLQLLQANGYGHGILISKEPQKLDSHGKPLRYYHVRVGRVHGQKVAIYSNKTRPKTPKTATQLSTALNSILTLKGKEWVFQYETRVAHFNINEYERNWKAFMLGRQAMDSFLLSGNVAKMLPNLSSYLKISTLGSGRSNPYKDFNVRTQKKVNT